MSIWLAILIPLIVSIAFLILYQKRIVWWETLIPFIATIIIVLIFKYSSVSFLTKDYEYWGNYVTEVRYYEPWDEYISQTCTRSCCCDSKGENCSTETYDCSYVEDHPSEWIAVDNLGESQNITEEQYNKLKKQFSNSTFIDMHRDYNSYDGDMYSSTWKGNYEAYEFIASIHKYENKVQASKSVFNYPDVTPSDIKTYGLYQYPEIKYWEKLPAIISPSDYRITKDEIKNFDWINGQFGVSKQIRVWILIFRNVPRNVGLYQEALWKGGNKNELNICICLNKQDEIKWVHVFTWSEVQHIKVDTRDFIEDMKKLNLNSLAEHLKTTIPKYWIRKEFKDFNYLDVPVPSWAIITTYILSFLASIGINIWSVSNEFENEDNSDISFSFIDKIKNFFKK